MARHKEGVMANGKQAWAYLDGFAAASVTDMDELMEDAVFGAMDADGYDDPFLTPWKRGYRTAIRTASGH
jgi:hypothetical protein